MEENEQKLQKHVLIIRYILQEKLFEKKFRDNTLGNDNTDKAPKKTQRQLEEISTKVKDIEGQMNNLYRY